MKKIRFESLDLRYAHIRLVYKLSKEISGLFERDEVIRRLTEIEYIKNPYTEFCSLLVQEFIVPNTDGKYHFNRGINDFRTIERKERRVKIKELEAEIII